jgi:hypothetical protein
MNLTIQRDKELSDVFIWVKKDGHIIGSISRPTIDNLGIKLEPGEERQISLVIK